MVITYHNGSCFRIQFGDIILAFNPPGKNSAIKSKRFGADVVFVTTNHEDMNGITEIGVGDRQPFVIAGPGEYEVKDVFIRGFSSQTLYGGESIENTVYMITLEGMNLCFTGALGVSELPAGMRQVMEHIDVLFVPVGGDGVLTGSEAAKLSVSIGPGVVIPVPFGKKGDESVKIFEKEMGSGKVEPLDKLTLKKRDLEGKEGEVVIMKSATV